MDTQSRQTNSRTGTHRRPVPALQFVFWSIAFAFVLSGCANHRAQADANTGDSRPRSPAIEPRKGAEKLAVVAPLKTVSDSRPAPARAEPVPAKSTLESPKAAEQQPPASRPAPPKVIGTQAKPAAKPAQPAQEEVPISNEITETEAVPQNALIFKGPNSVATEIPIRRSTPWFLIWVGVSFVGALIGVAIWRALQRSAQPAVAGPKASGSGKLSLQGAPKGPETGLGE
jgi:hypothetical protein